MKSKLKYILFAALLTGIFIGCDDDTDLPPYNALDLAQDFDTGTDNTLLVIDGWKNYASEGSALWKTQIYQSDGYAEFNPFGSGDASNVGWLISPAFTLAENNNTFARFRASQSFVSSTSNTLEALVSTDYDGTNVEAATWVPLHPNVPTSALDYYEYVDSGELSLSAFSGTAYIAFRVTGSGTNTALDGAYQVDSFRIYTK